MAALATGEVAAVVLGTGTSLVLAVGQEVIERVPPAVEDAAIDLFGTADKLVLVMAIVAVALALGAALGMAAARRFWIAAVGFTLFAALGVAAVASRPTGDPALSAVAVGAGVGVGLLVLRRRLAPAAVPLGASSRDRGETAGVVHPAGPTDAAEVGRRRFLRLAVTTVGAVAVTGFAGRGVARWLGRGTQPGEVTLGPVSVPLARPASAASFEIDGLSPLFTPNPRFFRIDTALAVPRVELETWRLRVTGMVDQPFELTFEELNAMPQVEADITLACVSNEVGGDLVGNARWQGVPLADLLERAGVRPGATQIVGRSVDGWTAGFPTETALDGRTPLVALAMNGEPLPRDHGFPARLVVPGLFGYVSATKWLSEIELTTFEDFDGYWVPRGWSKLGPVETQARIDVPGFGSQPPAGLVPVAGVAWAPTLGISRVEVAVDEGPWKEATLAGALDVDTWRQWRYDWDAAPGRHELRVRATDGAGVTQTAERTLPRPGGATGNHTIAVNVVDRG